MIVIVCICFEKVGCLINYYLCNILFMKCLKELELIKRYKDLIFE